MSYHGAADPETRPPTVRMRVADEAQKSSLQGRYATAIFDLAVDMNLLDTVAADLASLKRMLKTSADLLRLVKAPVFSRDEQKKGLSALADQMGMNQLTRSFVLLLADKRRLFVLTDIIAAFDSLVAKKRVLKAKLNREPLIETHVDPSLLGGLIVKVGSKMIDSSLRTKLAGLRTAMRGN